MRAIRRTGAGETGTERGESLIEVIISMVVIGVVASAWFVTYSYETTGSTLNKHIAQSDTVLRSYAEATKTAVRNTCTPTNGGTPFTAQYTAPSGFNPPTTNDPTCPSSTTVVKKITLTVTFDGTQSRALQIDVRTP